MSFNEPTLTEVRNKFSNYQNITFRGKGGFKAVYFGEINRTREAIKLVHIPEPPNPESEEGKEEISENIRRVAREINILGKCKSPYIVKLGKLEPQYVRLENNNYVAYSEEYLDGSDLYTLINGGYRPDKNELKFLCVCLLKAIKELWIDYKVVHRDIKPLNIIKVNDASRGFVLLDLGIAYVITETGITHNPAIVPGSRLYKAPEMFHPNFRETLDYRSDLYTMGLTLYEYATGLNPFYERGDNAGQTVSRILSTRPRPLLEIRNDLDEEFCYSVDQLLKKKPSLRPSNIEKLIFLMEN